MLLTNNIILYTRLTYVETYQNILEHFFHENAVLTIGLTDQSYYSICHFMVRLFIRTVKLYFKLMHKKIDYRCCTSFKPYFAYFDQMFGDFKFNTDSISGSIPMIILYLLSAKSYASQFDFF